MQKKQGDGTGEMAAKSVEVSKGGGRIPRVEGKRSLKAERLGESFSEKG